MLDIHQLDWELELNDNINKDSEPVVSKCAKIGASC